MLLGPDECPLPVLRSALSRFEGCLCADDPEPLAVELAPLVLLRVEELGIEQAATDNLRELLRGCALRAASLMLMRDAVLRQLEARLSAASVSALLLKGAALDGYVYPRAAFRMGGDVDLLLRESDYARIDGLLAGLAAEVPKYPGEPARTAFAVERTFAVREPLAVRLDVHRALTIPFACALDPEGLFSRSSAHPAFRKALRVLSPEDNLLHFALHGFYDMALLHKQTVDAYLLIRRHAPDWQVLVDRARTTRTFYPLAYLLEGVREAFGFFPASHAARELRLSGLRRRLARGMLTGGRPSPNLPQWRRRANLLATQWLLSGNRRGLARYQLNYVAVRLKDLAALGRARDR
jgi:hypothetical protein